MSASIPEAKRAEWREWAQREFGSDEAAVEIATTSVLDALINGYTVDDAMDMARRSVAGRASDRASFVSDPAHLRGRVGSFRERNELMGNKYGSVWDFRVDGEDQNGGPVATAVEMRGIQFSGSIGEGDLVEIAAPWKPGQIVRVKSVRNITQNSTVTASGHPGSGGGGLAAAFGRLVSLIGLLLFVVVVLAIAAVAYSMWRGF